MNLCFLGQISDADNPCPISLKPIKCVYIGMLGTKSYPVLVCCLFLTLFNWSAIMANLRRLFGFFFFFMIVCWILRVLDRKLRRCKLVYLGLSKVVLGIYHNLITDINH